MSDQIPKNVFLFPNMNIVVTDEHGGQIPDLQIAPITLWCQHAEKMGYNVEGLVIETPSQSWRIIKFGGHWNREPI